MKRKESGQMIPKFQEFMLPILTALENSGGIKRQELLEKVVTPMNIPTEERDILIKSGKQTIVQNRFGWALTNLKKANLIDTVERAVYQITDTGRDVLKNPPSAITRAYLSQFESFEQDAEIFDKKVPTFGSQHAEMLDMMDSKTPEEMLEESSEQLNDELVSELLTKIKSCSPAFFERLVVDVLVKMGYGGSLEDAGRAIGKTNDEGIDGIINEDRLGLDVVYIQAKRWQNPVGRPEIQAFAGSLDGQRARKGIFITTSRYTNGAKEYVKVIEKKIVLIDGQQLAELMIEFDVGVNEETRYVIKRLDMDYFEIE